MRRFIVKKVPKKGESVELARDEARHAIKVLRLGSGQKVEALDGHGMSAICKINLSGSHVFLEYFDEGRKNSISTLPIELGVALTKSTSFEWVIEKAVELGVQRFQPLLSDQSVIKLNKGIDHYLAKWQKIADQALKQCGRLESLEILAPIKLDHKLTDQNQDRLNLICNESLLESDPKNHLSSILLEKKEDTQEVCILVGPEGGWSAREQDLISNSMFQNVSLGSLTLRAETAALYCASLINGFFYWTKAR